MSKKVKIKTLESNNRMSTQELLQLIYQKVEEGYTDFEIDACGQHDIGGSVWSKISKNINFKVTNPGQRVGGMAMSGTKIVVEGSASADVGWLNSGAEIVVKGDGGDTTAHCAATGNIYIAGRTGTRSGALMKHDPKFLPPQFWVLKNTGSFSFEFMGGGIAVVCGHDCEKLESVLGRRSCVGMVGGVIYFRGKHQDIAECVEILPLDKNDEKFLQEGLKKFLNEIGKNSLYKKLTNFSEWKKIVPKAKAESKNLMSIKDFRLKKWVKGGIFGDFVNDNLEVYELAATGEGRLNIPVWDKSACINCEICKNNCPQGAIKGKGKGEKGKEVKKSNDRKVEIFSCSPEKCIGCGICEAVCPKSCWSMQSNIREIN